MIIGAQEKQKIMGMTTRDMRLGSSAQTLADVSCRGLAYSLGGVYRWILPSDLIEVGGELDSWMSLKFTGSILLDCLSASFITCSMDHEVLLSKNWKS